MISEIRKLPPVYWLLNIFQMLEKLAYWTVLLQLPIYIAQKDAPGGLHWEQTVKGLIFFIWAAVQNTVPVFAGGFADKYGTRKTLRAAILLIAAGYLIIGTQRDLYLFTFGTIVIGLGSGIFKPALQGAVASTLNEKQSSLGWSIYFMLLNIAVFFGPPLSKYLREISWYAVFAGSAIIILSSFVLTFFLRNQIFFEKRNSESPIEVMKKIFSRLIQPKIYIFIILMSGFAIIYMQFYETLPNFIFDWTDTSGIVQSLRLPDFLTFITARGRMISYEWFYNLNAGLIIIGIVLLSRLVKRFQKLYVIALGTGLCALGLMFSGLSMLGSLTIAGFLIYTIGEMLTNPKFAEYLSESAPMGEKSLYMSFLNLSMAIGLGGGSLLGGWLYKHYAEKASLAYNYLLTNFSDVKSVSVNNSFETLQIKTGLNAVDATNLLWNYYQPYKVWLPFLLIGIISVAGLILYKRKQKNNP